MNFYLNSFNYLEIVISSTFIFSEITQSHPGEKSTARDQTPASSHTVTLIAARESLL